MSIPTTSVHSAEGGGPRHVYWRDIVFTSVVSAVLVALEGAAIVVYAWGSFQTFHGEYMIPWAAGIAILRSVGASGASLVACLYVTAILHGIRRDVAPALGAQPPELPARNRARTALVAAAAVPILYAPVTAFAMGSAMLTAYLGLGLRPATFFHLLEFADVGRGLFTAVVMGAVPSVWSIVGSRLFCSRRRRLGFKLLVTWSVVVGLLVVVRIGTAIVAPADQNPYPPSSGSER